MRVGGAWMSVHGGHGKPFTSCSYTSCQTAAWVWGGVLLSGRGCWDWIIWSLLLSSSFLHQVDNCTVSHLGCVNFNRTNCSSLIGSKRCHKLKQEGVVLLW